MTDYRLFIHSLAYEFDEQAGGAARDALLVAVGRRMASRLPPPPCATVDALEIELNDILRSIGWGRMRIEVPEDERALWILHDGLPTVGALGDEPGLWLAAVLEGLYDGWLSTQDDLAGRYVIGRHADAGFEGASVVLKLTLAG